MRGLRQVVEERGIPLSLYRDQHGTFQRNDKHWTVEEQLTGRQTPTQMGRVLEELGIESIRALSPQAKGRIERMWKTFQNGYAAECGRGGAKKEGRANGRWRKLMAGKNGKLGWAPKRKGGWFRA